MGFKCRFQDYFDKIVSVNFIGIICGDSVVFYGYYDNKTNRYDIVEILLKVALNTIILATSPLSVLR